MRGWAERAFEEESIHQAHQQPAIASNCTERAEAAYTVKLTNRNYTPGLFPFSLNYCLEHHEACPINFMTVV